MLKATETLVELHDVGSALVVLPLGGLGRLAGYPVELLGQVQVVQAGLGVGMQLYQLLQDLLLSGLVFNGSLLHQGLGSTYFVGGAKAVK